MLKQLGALKGTKIFPMHQKSGDPMGQIREKLGRSSWKYGDLNLPNLLEKIHHPPKHPMNSKHPICLHSPSLTWNLKRMVSKRNLLLKGAIFRFQPLKSGRVLEPVSPQPNLQPFPNDLQSPKVDPSYPTPDPPGGTSDPPAGH